MIHTDNGVRGCSCLEHDNTMIAAIIWLTLATSSTVIHNPEFNGLLFRRWWLSVLVNEEFDELDTFCENKANWETGVAVFIEGLSWPNVPCELLWSVWEEREVEASLLSDIPIIYSCPFKLAARSISSRCTAVWCSQIISNYSIHKHPIIGEAERSIWK